MRYLIINADGYGFSSGISRAIEECIEFGTVRSLSANVNFESADRLSRLVRKHPDISVGCHLNPVVGRPVLDPGKVPTLLSNNGEFFYKEFSKRIRNGYIRFDELRAEMVAQVEKTRDLAGNAFSHIDFHMGLHRLPGIYNIFLDVVEKSGVGRVRTHRYFVGLENQFPKRRHILFMFESRMRIPKYIWNLWLRKKALSRGFAMPDWWVGIANMLQKPSKINVEDYRMMLVNLPQGFNEFVVHPGYVDDDLKRWTSYLDDRTKELKVLLNEDFKTAILESDVCLAGYRDIPLNYPI